MSDVVARAKAALEALGDEGPWTIDSEDGQPIIHEAHHYDSTDDWYDVDGANGGWVAHCEDLPVAEFIAEARSLVPELIAEVERRGEYLRESAKVVSDQGREIARLNAVISDVLAEMTNINDQRTYDRLCAVMIRAGEMRQGIPENGAGGE